MHLVLLDNSESFVQRLSLASLPFELKKQCIYRGTIGRLSNGICDKFLPVSFVWPSIIYLLSISPPRHARLKRQCRKVRHDRADQAEIVNYFADRAEIVITPNTNLKIYRNKRKKKAEREKERTLKKRKVETSASSGFVNQFCS